MQFYSSLLLKCPCLPGGKGIMSGKITLLCWLHMLQTRNLFRVDSKSQK